MVLVSWFLSMSVVVLGSSNDESRGPPESDGSVIPHALIPRAGIRAEDAVIFEPAGGGFLLGAEPRSL